MRGEQPTSLLGDYAALAPQGRLATDLRLTGDAPQEQAVVAVRGWLERHRRWLLVLDNVEEPQAVAGLLPRGAAGHVLVTSQADAGWEALADPVPVEVLMPTDAARFLLARTRQRGKDAEAAATTLAGTLGGLPLALEQAGAYVAATGTVTLAGYAGLFATRALELLKRGQPLGYQHTVATTWSLALQRLRETDPAAVDLLTLASFLAPDDLPLPLLAGHAGELPEPLAGTAADPLALADAVAALRRFSLVRVVADGLYVHRLLQTVVLGVLGALDAEDELAWAATAVRLLRAGYPRSDEVPDWPEYERLLPHALTATGHGRRFEVEPERWLWLLARSAIYLWYRGQYRQALTLSEQTLTGRRRVLGDDHPDTLTSISNLATAQYALGDLDTARELFEQALAGLQRVLGEDHIDTMGTLNSLAVTRRALGDFDAARELHEQALAGRRRVLGDDHPYTLMSMNNLATTIADLGDLDAARELHEQALAGRQRVLGDDHPDTLASMSDLAAIRRKLGGP